MSSSTHVSVSILKDSKNPNYHIGHYNTFTDEHSFKYNQSLFQYYLTYIR